MNATLTFKQTFLGSLIAGGSAAVANNIWHLGYTAATGVSVPQFIHIGSVTGGSLMSLIVAGIGFFIAQRWIPKGTTIYLVGAALLALLSCIGLFAPELPDGTPTPAGYLGLTLPLHLIGGAATLLLPGLAKRVKS
jgi:hypothetical protein